MPDKNFNFAPCLSKIDEEALWEFKFVSFFTWHDREPMRSGQSWDVTLGGSDNQLKLCTVKIVDKKEYSLFLNYIYNRKPQRRVFYLFQLSL